MDFQSIIRSLFAADSLSAIAIRFGIWLLIAVTIIISVDAVNAEQQVKNLKSNLGLFLMMLLLAGIIIYLVFGFVPSF